MFFGAFRPPKTLQFPEQGMNFEFQPRLLKFFSDSKELDKLA
jgi:hypothetical protein